MNVDFLMNNSGLVIMTLAGGGLLIFVGIMSHLSGNKVVVMNQYRNISEMFHKGLTNLTFDGLISIPDKYDRDTTDIHNLAERMVNFMKDYDYYDYMDALNNDETDAGNRRNIRSAH